MFAFLDVSETMYHVTEMCHVSCSRDFSLSICDMPHATSMQHEKWYMSNLYEGGVL
jgi:hypothetical protein